MYVFLLKSSEGPHFREQESLLLNLHRMKNTITFSIIVSSVDYRIKKMKKTVKLPVSHGKRDQNMCSFNLQI